MLSSLIVGFCFPVLRILISLEKYWLVSSFKQYKIDFGVRVAGVGRLQGDHLMNVVRLEHDIEAGEMAQQ